LGLAGLGRTFNAGTIGATYPLSTVLTSTDTDFTGCTFLRPWIIYFAITIIVLAVAKLWLRLSGSGRTFNAGTIGATYPFPDALAIADPYFTRLAFLGPQIIDDAVAIVISAVTAFGLRLWSITTDPRAVFTGLHARTTGRTAIAC
jgi:hypothetical protein